MPESKDRKSIMKKIEAGFELVYLLLVFFMSLFLMFTSEIGEIRFLYGVMAFILGLGDSFHLVPRIYAFFIRKNRNYFAALGIGKLVTSVTMTVFYFFLWEIGRLYYGLQIKDSLSLLVYGLGILRIIICFLPYNRYGHRKYFINIRDFKECPFCYFRIVMWQVCFF